MGITKHSTPAQDDCILALSHALTEIVPQMVEGEGTPLSPLMMAVALTTAAGMVLRALPMETRIQATEDLKAGLDTLLTVPAPGTRVS